jgi:hypothetical protein
MTAEQGIERVSQMTAAFATRYVCLFCPFPVTLRIGRKLTPCSLCLSATNQQYFSLRINPPAATSQQYFSLRTNQHQPSATSHPNRLEVDCNHGDGLHRGRIIITLSMKFFGPAWHLSLHCTTDWFHRSRSISRSAVCSLHRCEIEGEFSGLQFNATLLTASFLIHEPSIWSIFFIYDYTSFLADGTLVAEFY